MSDEERKKILEQHKKLEKDNQDKKEQQKKGLKTPEKTDPPK